MEIHKKLDELVEFVESSRTMPLSSSAIVNKTEILGLVKQIRDMLPDSLAAADAVIAQREELLEEARANASKILTDARAEQIRLVNEHTVMAEARRERGRTLEQTREEVDAMKAALDDHVDAKLAHVEVVAERIVGTVREGRERLHRTTPYDELAAVSTPTADRAGASEGGGDDGGEHGSDSGDSTGDYSPESRMADDSDANRVARQDTKRDSERPAADSSAADSSGE